VILRRMEAYDLPDALRLTIGSEEANHAFIAALRAFSEGRTRRHG
jgi:histidinol-phosphate aminotransferase